MSSNCPCQGRAAGRRGSMQSMLTSGSGLGQQTGCPSTLRLGLSSCLAQRQTQKERSLANPTESLHWFTILTTLWPFPLCLLHGLQGALNTSGPGNISLKKCTGGAHQTGPCTAAGDRGAGPSTSSDKEAAQLLVY